jgi:hypothetical protein
MAKLKFVLLFAFLLVRFPLAAQTASRGIMAEVEPALGCTPMSNGVVRINGVLVCWQYAYLQPYGEPDTWASQTEYFEVMGDWIRYQDSQESPRLAACSIERAENWLNPTQAAELKHPILFILCHDNQT